MSGEGDMLLVRGKTPDNSDCECLGGESQQSELGLLLVMPAVEVRISVESDEEEQGQ